MLYIFEQTQNFRCNIKHHQIQQMKNRYFFNNII